MRRSLFFVLAAVMLVALAACAGNPTPVPTTSAPAATQPTTVPSSSSSSSSSPAAAPTVAASSSSSSSSSSTASSSSSATASATGSAATTSGSSSAGALQSPEQAALAAAGGQKIGGTVTVLGTWGGSEQDSFMAMVQPFMTATGVQVQYTGTRDLNAVLTTQVQGGNPPDLAGLPGPGQMAQFGAQGKLVDLSTVLDMNAYKSDYSQSWVNLGTVNGKLVGVFIKTAAKGMIWYDPKVWQSKGIKTPQTWDDLMALTKQLEGTGNTAPWCIGLESGAASGWPGTDWLEDIVLRQSGDQAYNNWWSGKLAWTSPEITKAWQAWGQIIGDSKAVYGGANTMLTTNFGDIGNQLFANPPGCYMMHQASFITDFLVKGTPGVKPVTDFDFIPFPSFGSSNTNAQEVAGDLFGMFKDTPQSRALIKYLVSPEAQAIWVQRGGALSPNKRVPMNLYPDPLSQKAAQLQTTAQVTVFDASDLMPDAMNTAFYKAILDFVQNPGSLNSILQNLESTRKTAYP